MGGAFSKSGHQVKLGGLTTCLFITIMRPKFTFTQSSDPSITEAPSPAYHFPETFANYSENTNSPSGDEPPPPYDPGPSLMTYK